MSDLSKYVASTPVLDTACIRALLGLLQATAQRQSKTRKAVSFLPTEERENSSRV